MEFEGNVGKGMEVDMIERERVLEFEGNVGVGMEGDRNGRGQDWKRKATGI